MKKLLTILLLTTVLGSAKSQTPNSTNQYATFFTYPLRIQVFEAGTFKELAYLEMDTANSAYTRRGNLTIAIWHIGRFMASYTEQYLREKDKVSVLKGISDNINDDGTVKDWGQLSYWLDRARELGLR